MVFLNRGQMYIFEFTDKEIKIYNQKKKCLIKEPIPERVIVNNKIYDYLKLVGVLNKIVNKYKVINTLFRIRVKLLLFEKMTPSELYLCKSAFKSVSNIAVDIINVYRYFDSNYLFVSGNIIYFENKPLKLLKKGEYVLVGNADNYKEIRTKLIKKYKVNILEYENSDMIIYEKV